MPNDNRMVKTRTNISALLKDERFVEKQHRENIKDSSKNIKTNKKERID